MTATNEAGDHSLRAEAVDAATGATPAVLAARAAVFAAEAEWEDIDHMADASRRDKGDAERRFSRALSAYGREVAVAVRASVAEDSPRCKTCGLDEARHRGRVQGDSRAWMLGVNTGPQHPFEAAPSPASVGPTVEAQDSYARQRLVNLLNEPGYGLDAVWLDYEDAILHEDGDGLIYREIIERAVREETEARYSRLVRDFLFQLERNGGAKYSDATYRRSLDALTALKVEAR